MTTEFNYLAAKNFKIQLENVIDSKGLNYILNELVNICYEKSAHVSENWQDNNLSNQWDKTASKLDAYRLKLESICPLF